MSATDTLTIAKPPVSQDQIDLVRRTVAKDATPDELELYFYDCARRGVHPLDRLIHFTKRSGKYTPITSIDFMRTRAADSGEYAGNDDPVFDYAVANEAGYPTSAFVTVYRIVQGQRCAFSATARWREYFPGDQQGFMWKKMPNVMLGKCAEALALRKAFPQQLAGLYASEEMDQAVKDVKIKTKRVKGVLESCVANETCSVVSIKVDGKGWFKPVCVDTAFDAILVQLGERAEKREVEVDAVEKAGPKGKYWELSQIVSINGKPYLEGALIESIEKVKAEKGDPEEITDGDEAAFLSGELATECISPAIDFGKKK